MTIKLGAPADVIAAAPALLGFTPTDSIVVYLLGTEPDGTPIIKVTIRCDITISASQAASFARTCHLNAAKYDGALLLAVCSAELDDHAAVVLDGIRDSLTEAGITVRRRLTTRDVTAAGTWIDPDTGAIGTTYPYTDSLLTAQRIHDGAILTARREDLVREFDPITPAPAVAVGDHAVLVSTTMEDITDALTGASRYISATLSTRAGILITSHPALRDAMLHLALNHERAATNVWTHIARQLRGRPRTEALTIAAVCYCLINDSVRAAIAADIAITEATDAGDEPPTLAVMLLAALESGIEPALIRRVLTDTHPGT